MKKSAIQILLAASICIGSSAPLLAHSMNELNMQKVEKSDVNVSFTIAQNYFVRNDYKDNGAVSVVRIKTQQEFDAIFGMAPTAKNQPTKIDFAKNQVIALIAPVSNKIESLNIESFTETTQHLMLNYQLNESKNEKSFSARYTSILIVDKKKNKTVIANRQGMVGADMDEFGCKPSTGYTFSKLKNECIASREINKVMLSTKDNSDIVGILFNEDNSKVELIGWNYRMQADHLILQKVKKTKSNIWKSGKIALLQTPSGFIIKDGANIVYKERK